MFQNPDPGARSGARGHSGVGRRAGRSRRPEGPSDRRRARFRATHANFVVNDGTATARDIRALVEAARRAVRERFGVTLRDEVVYPGDDFE